MEGAPLQLTAVQAPVGVRRSRWVTGEAQPKARVLRPPRVLRAARSSYGTVFHMLDSRISDIEPGHRSGPLAGANERSP